MSVKKLSELTNIADHDINHTPGKLNDADLFEVSLIDEPSTGSKVSANVTFEQIKDSFTGGIVDNDLLDGINEGDGTPLDTHSPTQANVKTYVDAHELTDNEVTFAKMQDIGAMKVIGNATGSSGNPAELQLLDEDDMVSNSATSLATQQSIKEYVKIYATPFYTVKIENANDLTLPSEFTGGNLAEYSLISMGSILREKDTRRHQSNSTLYQMNVDVLQETTIRMDLFRIDDSIYIYDGSTLKASRETKYESDHTPLDFSFTLTAGEHLISIVINDYGDSSNECELAGDLISEYVRFIAP